VRPLFCCGVLVGAASLLLWGVGSCGLFSAYCVTVGAAPLFCCDVTMGAALSFAVG
jgi:hypothetical protein